MRRNARRRQEVKKWWEDKRIIISGAVISFLLALIIGVALYSSDERFDSRTNKVANKNQVINMDPETEISDETESTSTMVGKSVEEAQNDIVTSNSTVNYKKDDKNATVTSKTNSTANSTSVGSNSKSSNIQKSSTTKKESKQVNTNAQEQKSIEFKWPVKGDIIKAFSVDNLLYSSTLQEWTVHNGIDIKADKAAIICSAADGTIKSIKNDPRYGLTVIIEHESNFKTVYSNLLTSEFVVEGEKVKQGQTIGTVGNSANFEVADDLHLHFELLKNNEYVDPMLYLK